MSIENENNAWISLYELNQLTQRCLAIMSLMDKLAGPLPKENPENDNDKQHAARVARTLTESMRKIKLASLMYERTLICVSGMQGAGKTTLMKHFYGLDDDCLNISLQRGEGIPVFITEDPDMEPGKKPKLYAVRIAKDAEGDYIQQNLEMTPGQFREASKGFDAATLYLELRVPNRYTKNKNVSFVLLPGYETQRSYRETLVEFAVSSSDAAIFAFDERLLSQQDNYNHLEELSKKFGANIIYAITRSDSSADGNAAVRETFMRTMGIKNEEQVVCTGAYPAQRDETGRLVESEKNKEWIQQLARAVNSIANYHSQENNISYLRDAIDDIRGKLFEIDDILKMADDEDDVSHTNDKLLRLFDAALERQVAKYQKALKKAYGEGCEASKEKLGELFKAQNSDRLKSFRKAILGANGEDLKAAEQIVRNSLKTYEEGEDGEKVEVFVPAQCGRKALEASLQQMESSDNKDSGLRQLLDTDIDAQGKRYLLQSKKNLQVPQAIYDLIREPGEKDEVNVKTTEVATDRTLMKTLVEIATYYYGVSCYDVLAEEGRVKGYIPCGGRIKLEDVERSAKSANDFIMGFRAPVNEAEMPDSMDGTVDDAADSTEAAMEDTEEAADDMDEAADDVDEVVDEAPDDEADAPYSMDKAADVVSEAPNDASEAKEQRFAEKLYNDFQHSSAVQKLSTFLVSVVGVDLIGDAKVNLLPQLAASFGVGQNVAAVAAGISLAAGAAVAVGRDLERVQCDDLNRAEVALETYYSERAEAVLEDYKEQMKNLRYRLECNLYAVERNNRNAQRKYNAQKQVNAALNLLDDLSDRCAEKLEENFL